MLMVNYSPRVATYLDCHILNDAILPCKIVQYVNSLHNSSVSLVRIRAPCTSLLSASSFYWKCRNQHSSTKKWLCLMHDPIPSEDEYRSSRNIAISLFRRYRSVLERGGGENLKEFISAGVNAYALGCTDEGLRKELIDMKQSGVEIEAMESYGGSTSLKSKIASCEIEECILWLSIVFITILCTPQPTIVRWSSTPPVSDEERLNWKGFCAVIANAYFLRGMAWLPVKTLQLEQMAVVGHAEEPSVVAGRMRLVFSTLEFGVHSGLKYSELLIHSCFYIMCHILLGPIVTFVNLL